MLQKVLFFQSVSYSCAVYPGKELGSIFSATSSLGAGGLLLHRDISMLVLDKVTEIGLAVPRSCIRYRGRVRGTGMFERWVGGS